MSQEPKFEDRLPEGAVPHSANWGGKWAPSNVDFPLDPQAIAIEAASKYRNVALSGDKYGPGFTSVTIEASNIFLPALLDGIAVSRVQLVPMGDELALVFTREDIDA